jgi:class 3 adenylate cyclase
MEGRALEKSTSKDFSGSGSAASIEAIRKREISIDLTAHRISVLLVDDQALVAEIIRQHLTPHTDIELMHCSDPEEAVGVAEKVGATVILQDLVMPTVSGLDLVEAFRANHKTREVPIIVLSSHEEPFIKADAFGRGANDYLVKPPDQVELIARIRYHSKSYINLLEKNEVHEKLLSYAARLEYEQQRSERLLLNILPKEIAERLKGGERDIADYYFEASVLFADIVNFTPLAARLKPKQIVDMLNQIFSAFDELTARYGLEKIKTIGDAYMVVGGIPRWEPNHAAAVANMALAILGLIDHFRWRFEPTFDIRIGLHIGPVVAGVIGKQKFSYDLWGNTVNMACRLEAHGLPGHIQVTEPTMKHLAQSHLFKPRGEVHLKGMGPTMTWFLVGRDDS